MSKVLFYSEAWGKGGIEAFIRNVTPALIESGNKVDIVSTWEWEDVKEPSLDFLGVHRLSVFRGYRPNQINRLYCGLKLFSKMLTESSYDAVWINTMNGMGFLYARAAQRHDVPIRVVHSHNSDVGEGMKALKRMVSAVGSRLFRKYSTCNVACSKAAGKYLFGTDPFILVPNGIDVDRFRYRETSRKTVRNELDISDEEILIGNVGRINPQKNPLFQVRVFSEYRKLDPTARYLMIGRPDMGDEVRGLARELGVSDFLTIIPSVDDAAPYYSALDIFLMPSLHEGLPFTKVEAQCASLPILCSDGMSRESDVTDLVKVCSLSAPAEEWAKRLLSMKLGCPKERSTAFSEQVAQAGFSLDVCAVTVASILNGAK